MRSLIDLVGRRRSADDPDRREETAQLAGSPPAERAATVRSAGTGGLENAGKPAGNGHTSGKASEAEASPAGSTERAEDERPVDEPGAERQAEPVAGTAAAEAAAGPGAAEAGTGAEIDDADAGAAATEADAGDGAETAVGTAAAAAGRGRLRRLPVVLGVLTALLGGTAAWFADEAGRLRDGAGARNVALTDVAGTSEVKGVVTDAVNTIFSFDYADMARTQQAADHVLTGDAVRQYDAMVAQVRAQAPRQKLVLTTTVTDSAVVMLQDGRARLLLFADQRSTRTVAKDTTYAAAMLAVDAVHRDGGWKISSIDTFTGRR